MTIVEAIECIDALLNDHDCPVTPQVRNSLTLAIQALQRIQKHRYAVIYSISSLLTGETER